VKAFITAGVRHLLTQYHSPIKVKLDSHAAVCGVGGGVSTHHGRRRRRADDVASAAAYTGLKLTDVQALRKQTTPYNDQ